METTEKRNGTRPGRWNPGYIFGIFMIIIYLCMAYLLVFTPLFRQNFSAVFRYSLGTVFFVYGIYRAYRQVKAYKE